MCEKVLYPPVCLSVCERCVQRWVCTPLGYEGCAQRWVCSPLGYEGCAQRWVYSSPCSTRMCTTVSNSSSCSTRMCTTGSNSAVLGPWAGGRGSVDHAGKTARVLIMRCSTVHILLIVAHTHGPGPMVPHIINNVRFPGRTNSQHF